MEMDEKLKHRFELLGKHIKYLREERNLTIKELALKTGIRREYLQKIENGSAYRVLLEKHLLKIADSLKIKLSELFNYKNYQKKQ